MGKQRILLVDDEKSFTEMLKLNLEVSGGYEVEIVNDPTNAIQIALEFKPSLILLDVIMPKCEGPDIAIKVKNNAELTKTPIIFLTATVTKEEVKSQGGKIGGHPFVAKPSNLTELLGSIEENLSHPG